MRLKIAVVAVTVLAILSMSLVIPAVRSSLAPSVAAAQTATKCDDQDFLKGVAKDLESFKDIGELIKAADSASLSKALLSFAVLRQKYEDDDKVPEKCFQAQLYMIAALGNYGDLVGLLIAAKADTTNQKVYLNAIDAQSKRAQKFLEYMTNEVKGVSSSN